METARPFKQHRWHCFEKGKLKGSGNKENGWMRETL